MTSLLLKRDYRRFGVKTLIALGAFSFGALSAAVVGMSPEEVVAGGFVTALEDAAPNAPGGSPVQVAGSEDFWLKASGAPAPLEPAAWSRAPAAPLVLAVGDRVTVSRNGADRSFKVIAVSAPFKDGPSMAVRVTAEDAADAKAQPVVFTVPLPGKVEAGKPRAS